MHWMIHHLGWIPALPFLAAGLIAFCPRSRRRLAAVSAIGALGISLVLSLAAFGVALAAHPAASGPAIYSFRWLTYGSTSLQLGWLLDPLTALMLVMVSGVGLLIFVYSLGYMAHDDNFTRFFGFLSLFAGAMLLVVIANSLLLFFIGWELVGLTSYLLIGFWYHKPSASAAAKKAFITTRIGDLGFFLGMLWLFKDTGTLLFYNHGSGCLEAAALGQLLHPTRLFGLTAATGISLLLFAGAVGKSGQVPLHVWLPDAMEGPTPVSALIHAATMVAAGVFLVARVYPLMDADPNHLPGISAALSVVAWTGAITAFFAAVIAVAQNDIKRVLAYSTVSQLGYMMLGLGVGGVAVGMFHLITHATFKALLFLGAGSVIHGCHDEQDIRKMGGLWKAMPVTFATYAAGMLALSGFPLLFSGFWSKDEILHAAHGWEASHWPFYLGLAGAFFTAFYMTRQVCYVFLGRYRGDTSAGKAHESPRVMTVPLVVLACFAVGLGFVGTPMWPWFENFLGGEPAGFHWGALMHWGVLGLMGLSSVVVLLGLAIGFWLYGAFPAVRADDPDPLEEARPLVFGWAKNKFYVDELYDRTVVWGHARWSGFCSWLDQWVWGGLVVVVAYGVIGISWISRFADDYLVNLGFDRVCGLFRRGGGWAGRWQSGQLQHYLRTIGLGLAVLVWLLAWGCRVS